jgi:prophage antirepressor-like protein
MDVQIRKFLEFNGRTIYFLAKDGDYWVAVKPICEALGVNYNRQFQNLKEHRVFTRVFAKQQMHDSSNRLQYMISLPEKFIYGWLFQIRSDNDQLAKYQKECCEILYNHFHGSITQRREVLQEKIEIKSKIEHLEDELSDNEKYRELLDLKAADMRTGKTLKELDANLVAEQLSIFN